MNNSIRIGAALLILGGCASAPEVPQELAEARQAVPAATNQRLAEQAAPDASRQARQELERANSLFEERAPVDHIRHHAYLAASHAEIVNAKVEELQYRQQIDEADDRRSEILLRSREREASAARERAERAEAIATVATMEATRASRLAEQRAEQARELASELEELKTEQDATQTVFTLDAVLFDSGTSNLKPGSRETIGRIAEFLQQHSDEPVEIYGHTDSQGSAEMNEELSEQRAAAVKEALVGMGVAAERIEIEGRGEAYPVATNDTVAGRTQNRRVEIVVGAADGASMDARSTDR